MMAMNASEGKLNAASMRFALVVGRFNSALGDKLVDGAMDCLTRHGAAREDVSVIRVPGAWGAQGFGPPALGIDGVVDGSTAVAQPDVTNRFELSPLVAVLLLHPDPTA